MPDTRTFDGKRFREHDDYGPKNRPQARQVQDRLKQLGWNTRLLKTAKGRWTLYKRKKKK